MGKAPEIRSERFESVEGGGRATAADVEAIARRVVEMLGDRLIVMPASRSDLIDAAELARRLGTRRSWVYAHAMELGAIRLGGSGRPRLRFDAKAAMDSLQADRTDARPRAATPRRRPQRNGPEDHLLPIKGGGVS